MTSPGTARVACGKRETRLTVLVTSARSKGSPRRAVVLAGCLKSKVPAYATHRSRTKIQRFINWKRKSKARKSKARVPPAFATIKSKKESVESFAPNLTDGTNE
jgi:hypothetical protein